MLGIGTPSAMEEHEKSITKSIPKIIENHFTISTKIDSFKNCENIASEL